MRLVFHEYEQLPKLAWCAVAKNFKGDIHIYHGVGVETFEGYFFEGAWNGEFTSANFDTCNFFIGSGGKHITNNNCSQLLFATSNHTGMRLYSIKEQDAVYISNSLPFILHMSNLTLDSDYIDYETDLNTILNGIHKYKKALPLKGHKAVQLHYYCNIILNESYQLHEKIKNSVQAFKDYQHYHDELLNMLRLLVKNAQAPERKLKYGIMTTISKGYDAAACAAMAREVDCDSTVSFDKPKKYENDCGADIAKLLGYKNIIIKDAYKYLSNTSLIETEFLASGELGNYIIFSAFKDEFKNNIICNGQPGDHIWDINATYANKEFCFDSEVFAGISQIEYRLGVPYLPLPMPMFGAAQWPSIHKISNSEEMAPYSIGGTYDRPIPRRILESRGVPREMFGVKKKGVGFNYRYDNLSRIKKRMSPNSFNSFYYFYKNNKRKGVKIIRHWILYFWHTKALYLNYALTKVGIRLNYNKITSRAISNPGAPSYLFNWAIHEMLKRYENIDIERI